jgi:uncharacterized membrane protein YfcA
MDIQFVILSALIGLAAGVSGGFWGVGGGWLIVPALLLFGIDIKIAVTASLLQMLPSSFLTVMKQVGKIGWNKKSWGLAVALPLCGMSFVGGFFGKPLGNFIESLFHSRVPHQAFYMVLLLYIFFNIIFSGRKGKGESVGTATVESALSKISLTATTGFFTGVVSSLLGIGGGTITRPVMRSFLRLPEDVTGMIARLAVFIVALSGSLSYVSGISAWDSSDPVVQAIMIAAALASGGMIGFSIGARMHSIVLKADNDLIAHKSFAIIVLLVSFSVACKLSGFLKTGQVILTVSGIALTFYLVTLTIISHRSIKRRLEINEDKS